MLTKGYVEAMLLSSLLSARDDAVDRGASQESLQTVLSPVAGSAYGWRPEDRSPESQYVSEVVMLAMALHAGGMDKVRALDKILMYASATVL
jgi:hypothetical protein